MGRTVIDPPKLAVRGFEVIDLCEVLPSVPSRYVSPEEHMHVAERAYVSGATHMARLHIERGRQAHRRLLLERTKWGAGIIVAFVLGWLFSRMGA